VIALNGMLRWISVLHPLPSMEGIDSQGVRGPPTLHPDLPDNQTCQSTGEASTE